MDIQKHLQLPPLLVAQRQRKDLLQKQVAGRASLHQASLCAFEKGRKLPNPELVNRIAAALGLSEVEACELHWAARHDGLLLRAAELGLDDASEGVSLALCAARSLPPDVMDGAMGSLRSAISAQNTLSLFRGAAVQATTTMKGLPMA